MIEHRPDHLGLFRVQHGLDLDHAILGIAPAYVAPLFVDLRMPVLAVALYQPVLAAQLLQLRRRHQLCMLQEQHLVLRRGNAQHRAHLGVRDLAAS